MAKLETIMVISKERTGKSGKGYRRVANVKPNASDPSKLDFQWLNMVAFATKSGGIAICKPVED